MTVLVITRDVVIIVVAIALFLATGVKRFPPAPIGKVTTAMQVPTVVLVLLVGLGRSAEPGSSWSATVAVYATAALTIASGLTYIILANRRREQRAE